MVITRCSNNYGPHQFPEKMIPLFISNLLDGQRVPLYGDGMNVRDSPFAGVLSEEERQATLTTFREHWQDEHAGPSAAGAAAVSSSATIGAGWQCYAVVHVVADKRALP